jgi:HPt (histidine-containing phosphotransfer) domain-containing protein
VQKLVKTAVSVQDPAVARLLPGFLARRAEDARLLEAALAAGDYAAIGSIGHRLKGLGTTYGFDAISDAGRAFEAAAAASDADLARRTLERYAGLLAGMV